MGCDIHAYTEKKVNGKWEFIEGEQYNERHYDVFSILADVRNGYGFAGVKTGEGFNPISQPKGIPNDASPEYLSKVEEWDCDGYSHSYFTAKEIKDFDWGQITMKRGTISLEEFKKLKESGEKPTSWSGSISGLNIETVEEHIAEKMISGWSTPDYYKNKKIYVNYHWSDTYSEIASYFLDYINSLSKYGDDEDVRIVFFFDN